MAKRKLKKHSKKYYERKAVKEDLKFAGEYQKASPTRRIDMMKKREAEFKSFGKKWKLLLD